ncbi:MAG TPA: ATP-binding protein [Candidatus Udaeobacter sp.]|nr:ATP-binding protein [Candidatus Udaeobacter sp.]
MRCRPPPLRLEVEDNGGGMTEEEVSKLLSYENEMKKAGLGIGLSYVLRMIRVHYGENGRFQIENRIGHGTTMTMKIPLTGKVRRVGVQSEEL